MNFENTDSNKLRLLADWFDTMDEETGVAGQNEVQNDLRRIAQAIDNIPNIYWGLNINKEN